MHPNFILDIYTLIRYAFLNSVKRSVSGGISLRVALVKLCMCQIKNHVVKYIGNAFSELSFCGTSYFNGLYLTAALSSKSGADAVLLVTFTVPDECEALHRSSRLSLCC